MAANLLEHTLILTTPEHAKNAFTSKAGKELFQPCLQTLDALGFEHLYGLLPRTPNNYPWVSKDVKTLVCEQTGKL